MILRLVKRILFAIPTFLVALWDCVPVDISARLEIWWYRIPITWRVKAQKAIVDFWMYLVPGILLLSWVAPDNGDWVDWSIAIGTAVVGVAINAARRVYVESFRTDVLGFTSSAV